MMIIRNIFRFHYTLPHRIIKTSYYLENKKFIDSITQSPLSSEQLQKIIQTIHNVQQEDVKIGLIQITLENSIMKEKLGEIKQLMKQYRELIDTAKYNETDLQKHDLGDFYEKDALVLLRECKMQEAFEPFKKSLSFFLELSEKKEDYICRRIDQILETMIIVIEDMGQIEQAREHLKYGLEIFEKLLGKQSEKYIQYLNKLANTYLTVENQKAIQLHQEALSIIGPMSESNFKMYLKTAIELMITQSNESFDKKLYETINQGLIKFGSIDSELTVYYHVLMSHIFYENQDFDKQEYHLKEAYKVYEQEKSALLMNIIVQKSLILQSVNKEEFFLTLINELSSEFSDSLELLYYRCKLLYKINENEGIEEFKNIQNKLYNKRLTQFIVDFATDIAKDGLKLQAIELLKDYPEYNHLVKGWQNQ